jgi:uncharacterized circularly permuted ATP-grasp superfamily protein
LYFIERATNHELHGYLVVGQTKELTYVLNNLPKLIIKKTNRDLGFKSVYGRKLNKEQLKDLKATILSPKNMWLKRK